MSDTMQGQVKEAGNQAFAQHKQRGAPQDSHAVEEALDPSSDFPEKPLNSPEQQDEIRRMVGPAGTGQAPSESMTTGDKNVLHVPVADKRGDQDMPGDAVGGINRHVGDFIRGVGDTEAGRKGTGGVDFSNAPNTAG